MPNIPTEEQDFASYVNDSMKTKRQLAVSLQSVCEQLRDLPTDESARSSVLSELVKQISGLEKSIQLWADADQTLSMALRL